MLSLTMGDLTAVGEKFPDLKWAINISKGKTDNESPGGEFPMVDYTIFRPRGRIQRRKDIKNKLGIELFAKTRDKVLLIRQFRHSIKFSLVELVAYIKALEAGEVGQIKSKAIKALE